VLLTHVGVLVHRLVCCSHECLPQHISHRARTLDLARATRMLDLLMSTRTRVQLQHSRLRASTPEMTTRTSRPPPRGRGRVLLRVLLRIPLSGPATSVRRSTKKQDSLGARVVIGKPVSCRASNRGLAPSHRLSARGTYAVTRSTVCLNVLLSLLHNFHGFENIGVSDDDLNLRSIARRAPSSL
jgi:hypothetical protein